MREGERTANIDIPKPKGDDRKMMDKEIIRLKLAYLEELRKMNEEARISTDRDIINKRIASVCDSIEQELGLPQKKSVGEMIVNINADCSNINEVVKHISDKLALKSKVVGV